MGSLYRFYSTFWLDSALTLYSARLADTYARPWHEWTTICSTGKAETAGL